jgi:outer membrane receptor protein involved in Fe transport
MESMFNMYVRASSVSRTALAIAAVAWPSLAYAQDSNADTASFGEIVVTAQGRTQNLQDVPVAVSVVTGQTLAQSNIRNMEQLSQRLPGIRIQTAPAADLMNIRGVGSSLNAGFEQSVATFVDGIYRGRSRSSRAAIFDVERVEVLKGPQTTFFGNNAIAGAFNITTRKPGKDFAVNASAFYAAEADEYAVELGVDIPVSDALAFRVAGKISGMEGYIKNTDNGYDGPNLNEKVGRLSMVWDVTDSIRTEARIDILRSRNKGVNNLELERCPPESPFAPRGACATLISAIGAGNVNVKRDYKSDVGPSFMDLDMIELNQVTTFDLGFSDLILNTGYYDHKFDNFNELHPFPFAITSPFRNVAGSPIRSTQLASRFIENYWQFSQEARLQSKGDGPIEYTIGLYYAKSRMNNNSNQAYYFSNFAALAPTVVPANTPIAANILNIEKSRTISAFAALTWHITDAFRVNPAVRYTNVRKEAFRNARVGSNDDWIAPDTFIDIPGATSTFGPILGVDLPSYLNPKRTFKDVLPSIGLEFDLDRDVMLYATYTKGFKAGGFAQFTSNSEFDPETVDSFEAGVKSQLFDRALTLNISAFYMKYKDLQEATTITLDSGAIRNIVGNVAASKVKGVEVSASLRVGGGLDLYADVGYLDAKYSKYPGAPCTIAQQLTLPAPCLQDLAGSVRAFSPKWSGSIGFNYNKDIFDDYEIRLNGNIFFTSGFYVNAAIDPYLYQPKFAKIDARIGFGPRDRKWELALIGRNLTDKYTASYRTPVGGALGTTQVLDDPRRSVGIQLSIQY